MPMITTDPAITNKSIVSQLGMRLSCGMCVSLALRSLRR
jgi:hypothetical protein